jgi:membrane protease YdiL (CAAX protease family)
MTVSSRKILFAAICLAPLVAALLLPGVGVLVSLAIVTAALVFIKDARTGTLNFVHHNLSRSILWGLIAGILLQISLFFLIEPLIEQLTNSRISLEDFAAVEGNLANYLLFLAVGLIFGGVLEELVFRGFVIGWGVRIFGERSGLALAILSAAIFGAAHMYQGIAGVLTTGLTGLLFGLLYIFLGRKLAPAIVAHMTVNFIGITQIYLGYY